MSLIPDHKIFITGATSHSGCHLVKLMQDRNVPVRLLTRNPRRLARLPVGRHEIVEADLTRPETYCEMLAECGAVIHLAHIRNAQHIVEACRLAEVKRLIVISSTRKFTKFPDAISQAVEQGEYFVTNSGLDWTLLRPSMIYGDHRDQNLAGLVQRIKRWPVFPLTGGGSRMQPVFVDDLCAAIFQTWLRPETIGRDYNLAGPQPLTLKDLLGAIKKQAGTSCGLIPVPMGPALFFAKILDTLRGRRELGLAPKIRRLNEDKTFDISLAQTELGFEPRSIDDGLARKIEWLGRKDHPYD